MLLLLLLLLFGEDLGAIGVPFIGGRSGGWTLSAKVTCKRSVNEMIEGVKEVLSAGSS
jgi:hypothetical protein